MARTNPARADSGQTSSSLSGRGTNTPSLLLLGVIVGPFYLALGIGQALVRDGFDLAKHALSHLANGPGGWVQTANFALSGLMVIASAVGIARTLGPKFRGTSWLLGVFGASMLAAAVFRADPVDGFPVGTPTGPPTSISTMGLLHFICGALGFTALGISCLVAGWAMSRRKERALARLSWISGLVVLLGFFGGFALASMVPAIPGTLGIWISVVVGWAWLSVVSLHLYRDPLLAESGAVVSR